MPVGPPSGSFTMRFDGTVTADTPYYPEDGAGGFTATEADSFAVDDVETVITWMVSGDEATANQDISIWDDAGNEVFRLNLNDANTALWDLQFGDNGPFVRGNWYVETNGTTPNWTIGFKVLAGK